MTILPKYKIFLLDWDGCLAKTLNVWLKNYSKLYKKYGIQTTEHEIIKKSWGNWEKGPKNLGVKDSAEFIQKLINNIEADLAKVKLYSGVKKLIENIKDNKGKIAIITSSKKKLVYPAIQYHELEKYIDCFLSCEDVEKLKPNPEIINKALSCLEADREKTIIIGDTPKDMEAGNNAGIATLLYFPKENEKFYDTKEMKKCKAKYRVNKFKKIN